MKFWILPFFFFYYHFLGGRGKKVQNFTSTLFTQTIFLSPHFGILRNGKMKSEKKSVNTYWFFKFWGKHLITIFGYCAK